MANKTRKYRLEFKFKTEGNRGDRHTHEVDATTVQRAISKLAKEINDGIWESRAETNQVPEDYDEDYEIRAADLLVIQATTETA